MYHATDIPGDPENMGALGHWARYFGISTLQPKTPAVLHTLADSCMRSDEHNNLWRVSWGVKEQEAEFLTYLKPYRESNDPATREKAAAVAKMVSGELNPFVWWRERTTRRVREKFGNQLPAIKKQLLDGDSARARSDVRLDRPRTNRVHHGSVVSQRTSRVRSRQELDRPSTGRQTSAAARSRRPPRKPRRRRSRIAARAGQRSRGEPYGNTQRSWSA